MNKFKVGDVVIRTYASYTEYGMIQGEIYTVSTLVGGDSVKVKGNDIQNWLTTSFELYTPQYEIY